MGAFDAAGVKLATKGAKKGAVLKDAAGRTKEVERLLNLKNERKLSEAEKNKFDDMTKNEKYMLGQAQKNVDDKARSDMFEGMSEDDIAGMLGGPTRDSEGVLRQRKAGGQVVKTARGGNPVGVGAAERGFGAVRMAAKGGKVNAMSRGVAKKGFGKEVY